MTGGTWLRPVSGDSPLTGAAFDTRKIQDEEIFFAWKGTFGDGHRHLKKLRSPRLKLIVAEREDFRKPEGDYGILLVPGSLEALQNMAREWVARYSGRIVAITGSSGKTSTKNWLASVLGRERRVLASRESFNNAIGCPVTLLSIRPEHEVVLLEMGMSGEKEIDLLASIARPHLSAVINVGHAHVGKVGSYEKILAAKWEIFNHMRAPALAFVPRPLARQALPSGVRKIEFGEDAGDYSFKPLRENDGKGRSGYEFRYGNESFRAFPGAFGRHVGHNLSLVTAICCELGTGKEAIRRGFEGLENPAGRGRLRTGAKQTDVFDDSYNANPESLLNFFQTLSDFPHSLKVAVVGELAEQDGELAHCRKVLQGRVSQEFEKIFLIGKTAEALAAILADSGYDERRIRIGSDEESVREGLESFLGADTLIGVKGSRVSKLENLVEKLTFPRPD